jgi:hypothetical protein
LSGSHGGGGSDYGLVKWTPCGFVLAKNIWEKRRRMLTEVSRIF